MKIDLSIVIPAFDEQERLGGSMRKILAYLATQDMSSELIVVDDGSSDNTAQVAEKIAAGFPASEVNVLRYEQNRGKGYAVRTGLLAARGNIAVFSDADLSTPIEEIHKLIDPIRSGECDVAFGSRALDRSLISTHQPWIREQGGRAVNLMIKTLSGLPFMDTQCGFKAFNMKKFRPLLDVMQIDRFGFDVEFLYVANYHHLRLKEIPVRWANVEGSKVNPVRDTRRMFWELTEIRKHRRKGDYELKGDSDNGR